MINHTKSEFIRRGVLLVGAVFFAVVVQGQHTLSNTISKDLADMQGGELTIEHHRGELQVRQSADTDVHLRMEISAEGKLEEEVKLFIETISMELTGSGKDWKISTSDQIKSWHSTFGSSKIKMQDGTLFRDIKELELHLVVEVPELATLSLKNKYEDIDIEEFNGNLNVELYTGELRAKDIGGALTLDLKYGIAEIGNVADANLTIYESGAKIKNCENLIIDSKYSDYQIGDATSLSLTSYEDEIVLKDVAGEVELDMKYGELETGNLGDVTISGYESDIAMQQIKNLKGELKYGEIQMESAGLFQLSSSHETDIFIGSVDQLVLEETKYGSVEVNHIATLVDMNSHETSLEVQSIGENFQELKIESKYEHIDFPLRPGLSYSLDADINYGDLEYTESLFQHQHNRVEKNSQVTVSAASEQSPAVKLFIRSHETNIDLRAK